MKTIKEHRRDAIKYVVSNIEINEFIQAQNAMDIQREPLYIADNRFYNKIFDLMDEYGGDYPDEGLTDGWYLDSDIDESDIVEMVFEARYEHNKFDELYTLNQCEGDLITWIEQAKYREYTRYYDKIVYKTRDGIYACYADDHDNYWKI